TTVPPRRATACSPWPSRGHLHWVGDQHIGELAQQLRADPVVDPGGPPLALDQPGLPQHLEVMRNRRTRQIERPGQVTHVDSTHLYLDVNRIKRQGPLRPPDQRRAPLRDADGGGTIGPQSPSGASSKSTITGAWSLGAVPLR